MIAPPCNKCGTRHWSQEDCPADKAKKAKVATPAPDQCEALIKAHVAEHMANRIDGSLAEQPGMANKMANSAPKVANGLANTTTYKHRDPDKRRAYQRDLMRRKRAQATASPQGAR